MGIPARGFLSFIADQHLKGWFMGRYGPRADQWERIADLLPGKDGNVGVTVKDNKRSSTRCCIGIARVFPGGIYRNGSAIRSIFISGSAVGLKLVSGSRSLPFWLTERCGRSDAAIVNCRRVIRRMSGTTALADGF